MADGWAQLDALLRSYDLAELIPWARERFVAGDTADQVALSLREQSAFRDKYAVIFQREAQGLPPVTVAEVLEYRTRARQLERMYGMPDGFVDPDRLMLADVSITVLQGRVQSAAEYVDTRTDIVAQMQQLYGLDRGAAIAYVLDPETAEPAITRTYQSAAVAAQARRQGNQLTRDEAEYLSGLGVTEERAAQGFGALAAAGQLTQRLEGERSSLTRQDELDIVAGSVTAQQRLDERARTRRATFDESGGFAATNAGITGLGIADR